jgi:hypothetical protein
MGSNVAFEVNVLAKPAAKKKDEKKTEKKK